MFSSNVQPKRTIHPRPTPWHCTCPEPQGTYRLNDPQLTRCPACGAARPDVPVPALVSATARGDCAPLQRWEDEGGHYRADEPYGEADPTKRAPAGLTWSEFLPRFFPGRRRHDLEALGAYAAYRSAKESPSGATT